MVTFQSREAVRDELATLFTTNGSWQGVYGYFPSAKDTIGQTPLLFIISKGTKQRISKNLWDNFTSYQFEFQNYILADKDSDNWDSADAEDKLDELDKVLRQLIFNNMGSMTTANSLEFDDGFSKREDVNVGGSPYIRETRIIIANLNAGAK